MSRLAPDWFLELPTDRGLVSTPLVVNGVLYFIGSMNVVRAVDATSGELLWEYDPEVRAAAGRLRAGWDHNRGIGFWKGKVYVATWDGRLIAIDARTGQGSVAREHVRPPTKPLYITGAPKIFKGKVLIGNGGTENGPVARLRHRLRRRDRQAGLALLHRPRQSGGRLRERGDADGREDVDRRVVGHGGGGNAWHGFTYDAELDQLYIGTGNGSPWNRKIRSPGGGDNLFLCSIVALNPDTGEYIWHYQTTPGETWDFNSNMDIVLADLPIGGSARKVILHAPKNGFFYVIDRTNGKLISAEPFTETTWATTDRPRDRPAGRGGRRALRARRRPRSRRRRSARTTGTSMSFNPKTGLAYYPAMHITASFTDKGIDLANWRSTPWIGGYGVNGQFVTGSSRKDGRVSSLQAWDPVRQRLAWEVPDRRAVQSRHADDRRQPRVPGPRGRHAPRVHGRHRQGTVAVAILGSASRRRRSPTR